MSYGLLFLNSRRPRVQSQGYCLALENGKVLWHWRHTYRRRGYLSSPIGLFKATLIKVRTWYLLLLPSCSLYRFYSIKQQTESLLIQVQKLIVSVFSLLVPILNGCIIFSFLIWFFIQFSLRCWRLNKALKLKFPSGLLMSCIWGKLCP